LAAPVIKKLIECRSLQTIDAMETATLHAFVVAQLLRSKRRVLDHAVLADEIKRRWPEAETNPWRDEITDNELAKFSSLDFTFSNLEEFSNHLAAKHCYLMIRDCRDEIYISDTPLVMHNQKQFGPYGNIGIGVPHIEIYYPLSPDIVLAYMCRLTMKEIESKQDEQEKALSTFSAKKLLTTGLTPEEAQLLAADRAEIKRAKTYYSMMKNDRLAPLSPDNVLFLNSLQVSSSYRYIAARKPEFQFVRKALKERPHWKEGLKLQVS